MISNRAKNIFDSASRRCFSFAGPAFDAAIHGHIAIVNALIKAGADVDAKTYEGSTPLIDACTFYKSAFSSYENYYTIIEALISSRADVNAVREKYSQTKTALSAVITDRKRTRSESC
jgi:ankyrin repeat protein